jgi:hypothetical protein
MDDVGTHMNLLTQLKNVQIKLIYTAGNSSDADLTSKMLKMWRLNLQKAIQYFWVTLAGFFLYPLAAYFSAVLL